MQQDIVAGIDLGTGNTVVVDTSGDVFVHGDGKCIFPSAVGWTSDGTCMVGHEAIRRRKSKTFTCFTEFKRLIGKTMKEVAVKLPYNVVEDDSGAVVVCVGTKLFSPEKLSEIVVREATQGRVKRCVVTCPAYFNDSQRRATRNAVEQAGISVMRVVNEPTAAACATPKSSEDSEEETVLIFDAGSGTTDISIVNIAWVGGEVVADVIATHGDTELGGIDIDAVIVGMIPEDSCQQTKFERAMDIKHALTTSESSGGITRKQLEDACSDIICRMVQCIYECMNQANMTTSDIQRVVLVGGTTRVPMIRQRLSVIFGDAKLDTSVDPDLAVAMGASNIARALDTGKGPLVLDLTPLTIGIEVAGGLVHPVIPRGSKVPCEFRSRFRPVDRSDTVVDITVVEGERPLVSDCHVIGQLEFDACEKLEICLAVDVHGILTVSATDMETGTSKRARVRAGKWSPDEVRENVKDAISHAEEDEVEKSRKESLVALDIALKNATARGGDICADIVMEKAREMGVDGIQELLSSVNVSYCSAPIPDIPSMGRTP